MIVMRPYNHVLVSFTWQITHHVVDCLDHTLHIDVLADFDARNRKGTGLDVGVDAALDIHQIVIRLARATEPGFDYAFPDLDDENARIRGAGCAAEGFELLFAG